MGFKEVTFLRQSPPLLPVICIEKTQRKATEDRHSLLNE